MNKKLREICTYHGDDGTSGYLLSEAQFAEIEKLFEERERELMKDVMLQVIPVSMHFAGEGDARCEDYRDALIKRLRALTNKDD